jgi:ADP-ribose pyrophosphatase YjhB (NUDIX family)
MVKRGWEPYKGMWACPGGGVDLGETVYEAGKREVREECSIEVEIQHVLDIEDFIRRDEEGKVEAHTVVIMLLARYVSGKVKAKSDAVDVGWFTTEELAGLDITPIHKRVVFKAPSNGRSERTVS